MTGGYFLLFRELHNKEKTKSVRMKFLAGKTVMVTDLKTGSTKQTKVSSDGTIAMTIKNPADFTFLQYQIVK
jgi:hypothetical protein